MPCPVHYVELKLYLWYYASAHSSAFCITIYLYNLLNRLCIGEKKGNVAYLSIYFEKGVYNLVGYADAGRDDHLPKLKIRDSDRHQRKLKEANGNDGERELHVSGKSYIPSSKDDIVRFGDGAGDINCLWQVYSDGSSTTSPHARWYLVSKAPRTCNDVTCPDGEICDNADLTCMYMRKDK